MIFHSDKVQLAKRFAIKAHGDQKYGDEFPYAMHLQAVESVLIRFGFIEDEVLRCGAFLHDVLEDTFVQYEEIEVFFGSEVASIVSLLTEPKGGNRQWRHEQTYPKIRNNENAVILKLADRIANIEAGGKKIQMYEKEYLYFRKSLCDEHHSKDIQKMWSYLDSLLFI